MLFVNNHINGIKNFLDMLNINYLNLMDKENCFILKSAIKYTKTAQKLILKLLKLIKNSKMKLWMKMRLSYLEPFINNRQKCNS